MARNVDLGLTTNSTNQRRPATGLMPVIGTKIPLLNGD
jgi:hypothetical protein